MSGSAGPSWMSSSTETTNVPLFSETVHKTNFWLKAKV